MTIYEMRATFGKLEDRVLTLKPGLNIIEAPNEWGKSTWCAFLVAMLYGIDTRARSTQTVLADKEKYAPWSGSPMAGRIDLNWNGRDITIERSSKGRVPFGTFSAYETATGLAVPELTAANCGQVLLGVERSVFTRAGFLRLADLPVTQDEALRRRLNALVTTGDESGAADLLAGKLRELKNSCRYNRTGLLPKAEAELAELVRTQQELTELKRQEKLCTEQLGQTEVYLGQLNNHQTALRYEAARADAARVAEAQRVSDELTQRLAMLEEKCAALPSRETAEEKLRTARELQQQWLSVQMEDRMLPDPPVPPAPMEVFDRMEPAGLLQQVERDQQRYQQLCRDGGKKPLPAWIVLVMGLLTVIVCTLLQLWVGAAAGAAVLTAGAAWLITVQKKNSGQAAAAEQLKAKYKGTDPEQWYYAADNYVNQKEDYKNRLARYQSVRGDLDQRYGLISKQLQELTLGSSMEIFTAEWQQVIGTWNACEEVRRDQRQAGSHLDSIREMARTAEAPAFEDTLDLPEMDTLRLISDYNLRQRQLQHQLSKLQGMMTAVGDEQALAEKIDLLQRRIRELEKYNEALELAQQTLAAATEQLQRRYAPRIAARAKDLFAMLTDGRYDRLNLTRELAVNAGAAGETTLHSAQWRSEGTTDQLYIALRLAVAEELTPDAPLVLDDALVRFDDRRLQNAMEILRDLAQEKQILLFTCQGRESAFTQVV